MSEGCHSEPTVLPTLKAAGRLIRSPSRLLLLFFIITEAAALLRGFQQNGHSRGIPESPLPTRAKISQAIALSGGYLERACGPDGKFVYEIETHYGQQASSYNIVRHAGAMYALAMLNRSTPDRKAVDAI